MKRTLMLKKDGNAISKNEILYHDTCFKYLSENLI